ncbi:hypothetical protein HGA64_05425, partial [Candidatus Falkowbacteria bacterium]|nr:hypothetical protein [Candidatus Falkowbacteria bacterium]
PGKSKKEIGDYGVNDFVQIGVNVAYFIQGIIGSLALLMFIWGGFTLMLSQGASDKIAAGKSRIVNAVIGLVIVLTSYMIIQFVLTKLGYTETHGAWYITPK